MTDQICQGYSRLPTRICHIFRKNLFEFDIWIPHYGYYDRSTLLLGAWEVWSTTCTHAVASIYVNGNPI